MGPFNSPVTGFLSPSNSGFGLRRTSGWKYVCWDLSSACFCSLRHSFWSAGDKGGGVGAGGWKVESVGRDVLRNLMARPVLFMVSVYRDDAI